VCRQRRDPCAHIIRTPTRAIAHQARFVFCDMPKELVPQRAVHALGQRRLLRRCARPRLALAKRNIPARPPADHARLHIPRAHELDARARRRVRVGEPVCEPRDVRGGRDVGARRARERVGRPEGVVLDLREPWEIGGGDGGEHEGRRHDREQVKSMKRWTPGRLCAVYQLTLRRSLNFVISPAARTSSQPCRCRSPVSVPPVSRHLLLHRRILCACLSLLLWQFRDSSAPQ
jgi:hypothetical protein